MSKPTSLAPLPGQAVNGPWPSFRGGARPMVVASRPNTPLRLLALAEMDCRVGETEDDPLSSQRRVFCRGYLHRFCCTHSLVRLSGLSVMGLHAVSPE